MSSEWNRFLRDSIPPLFVAAVASQPPSTGLPALAFLPATLRVDEPFWQSMVDDIVRELRSSGLPVLCSESGELCPLDTLLRRPSCVSRRLLSNDTLKRITGKQFVATSPRLGDASSKDPTHGGGEHGDDTALIELNVLEFGLAEMAACIHDLTAPPLLQPLSTTWLVELYGALLGLCKQHAGGVEVAAELLRGLPILPLHRPAGASLLSSCDGDAVYRGLPAEYKAKGDVWRESTLPNLRLLSAPMEAALDAAETAAPTQLLWILGVRPATPADLVSHVLREHEATYAAGGDELGRIPSWRGRHRRLRAQLRLLRRHASLLPSTGTGRPPLVLVPALRPGLTHPGEEEEEEEEGEDKTQKKDKEKTGLHEEEASRLPGMAAASDVVLTRSLGGLVRAFPPIKMKSLGRWRYCYESEEGLDVVEQMFDEHFLVTCLGATAMSELGEEVEIRLALPAVPAAYNDGRLEIELVGSCDALVSSSQQVWFRSEPRKQRDAEAEGLPDEQLTAEQMEDRMQMMEDYCDAIDEAPLAAWVKEWLTGLMTALGDAAIHDFVVAALQRYSALVGALPCPIPSTEQNSGIHVRFERLAQCYQKESFAAFGSIDLPMIDLPMPEDRKSRALVKEALIGLEGVLPYAEANATTVIAALGTIRRQAVEFQAPVRPKHLLPLLSWLNTHMLFHPNRDEARVCSGLAQLLDAGESRGLLAVPATDGDPNAPHRTVTLAESCWHEPSSAGAPLADILGIANLAPHYAGVYPLFERLGVRKQYNPTELCSALDILSDALMDGIMPFDEPQRAFATSALIGASTDRIHATCTFIYEALAETFDRDAESDRGQLNVIDADFFDKRRIYVPGVGTGESHDTTALVLGHLGEPRFSTSEDVFWFALSSDEEELARACGLHALAAHYPASLKSLFTQRLHVPLRPHPSTSRLIEALHDLRERQQSESVARVVAACQARLAERDVDGLGDEGPSMGVEHSSSCQLHGPACSHPACRAFSELFGRGGAAAGGHGNGGMGGGGGRGVEMLRMLGGIGTDAAESMAQARRMLDHALSMAKRCSNSEVRTNGILSSTGSNVACQECDEALPCDGSDADLRYATVLSSGVPLYLDRSLSVGPNAIGIDRDIRYHAESFGQLLSFLGNLLGPTVLPALHIFFEPPLTVTGRRRRELFGFNKDNSLFFSLRAFISLHGSAQSIWIPEVTCFWMRVLTHELAHNLAESHDRRHEMLMERLLEQSLPPLVREHSQHAVRAAQPQRWAHGRTASSSQAHFIHSVR